MKTEQIRVLQVFGRLNRGGAEGVIMNLYRELDKTKIQFDFVVHTDVKCAYDDEIIKMGGRIYRVSQFKGFNVFNYINEWNLFFKEHKEYEIVHSHLSSSAIFFLLQAKARGLTTIIHSHNTSSGKGVQALVKDILQYPLRFVSDYYMACSLDAGKWLFGSKVTNNKKIYLLKNAINIKEFYFNEEKRNSIRNELNISEDKKIIINVGRFHYQKNHDFLIDIFSDLANNSEDYLLLLVGEGELREEIQIKVNKLSINEKVKLLGVREDISDLLSASDLFLFPSYFEGLPLSLIEAQASSLPCLISDTIPDEVIVTDLIQTLSLSDSVDIWKDKVKEIVSKGCDRKPKMNNVLNEYDIIQTSKWLFEFYMKLSNEKEGK